MGQKLVCPHCNQGIDISVSKKKERIVKPKEIDSEMNLQQFIEWCKKSPQKQIKLISDWAEAQEIGFTMKSQWKEYINANSAYAVTLCKFSDEQIKEAFSTVEEERKKLGYTPALSTLLKKLTK